MDAMYQPAFVRELFDRMSGSYERMNYITSFGFSLRWRRQFLRHIPATGGPLEVIDLLTGMGETWEGVRRRFPEARFTALDFSDEMLKKAEEKNLRRFGGQILLRNEDVLESSLPSGYYDVVTCAFGLKTFSPEQLDRLAGEVRRILKPGGRFAFIEVSRPDNAALRFFYGFYLGKVIPVLGWLFLGNPTEYRMLWRYTSRFGSVSQVTGRFREAGLDTEEISYFGGCATGLYGSKTAERSGERMSEKRRQNIPVE
ncbi:class I SAM-dependent methyltransferase [Siphonobacter aquaeclarae]|uniref:Demethylmenaquinone methyltransferase / 2-methoxy-6-polyprenyl-1,4-benzoquinol methylase n=1 Tax=Siphonobacter aquaeclarae TaxID=563176 RepID=A0A1G9KW20_9BACT|nr:class I SAM-dependent methyltransferase [Siphonobacter aquaeclarae]SDL53809.1 demethylmenaquinone methyltransferase / 2-methoxy-6-polyprenyl-1,4-benzoquinol methylase [Siphonobacter aquaeclarae]